MNKNKHKKVLQKLINTSFSNLKGRKIYLIGMNLGKFSGGIFWLLPNIRLIFVHPKTEKWDNKLLTGLLAHELCHFEITKKYGWTKTLFFGILYWIIPNIRKNNEKETDRLTIKKGYSKELYEVSKKRAYKNTKTERHYLSSKEIREYAKSVKKW